MTRNNNRYSRRQYWFIHTLCGIVFCMFTFIYLYFYQGDVLAMAQHVLSGGATSYDRLIGASVITVVLLLVHVFVYSIVSLDKWLYSLTYVPSFLFLAIITDVSPDAVNGVYEKYWLWVAPIVLVLYALLVRSLAELDSLSKETNTGSIFSKSSWINMLCMTVMMLIVVSVSNTDITLHHRIKMENKILAGDFDGALEVGKGYPNTDASLTMLRAYALSNKGELAERLFEFPYMGGSKALYPDGNKVKSLMIYNGDIVKYIHSRRIGRNNVAADYKLCGQLADCHLRQFAHDIRDYYAVSSELPKHYKEALIMYSDVWTNDTCSIADDSLKAEYKRFCDIRNNCKDRTEIRTALKNKFSKTYWYYYACRVAR